MGTLISFFAMILYDVPDDAIHDKSQFYFFQWDSDGANPENCHFSYNYEYHLSGERAEPGEQPGIQACLDSDIYVTPYKILFEKSDGSTASLGFLGNSLDKNTDENGCDIADDQCCDIFRVFFGTNAAVLAVFALLTLIMIFRHPNL